MIYTKYLYRGIRIQYDHSACNILWGASTFPVERYILVLILDREQKCQKVWELLLHILFFYKIFKIWEIIRCMTEIRFCKADDVDLPSQWNKGQVVLASECLDNHMISLVTLLCNYISLQPLWTPTIYIYLFSLLLKSKMIYILETFQI